MKRNSLARLPVSQAGGVRRSASVAKKPTAPSAKSRAKGFFMWCRQTSRRPKGRPTVRISTPSSAKARAAKGVGSIVGLSLWKRPRGGSSPPTVLAIDSTALLSTGVR